MNDISSPENYRLSIYFDIPEELCQYNEDDHVDLQCTPDVKYDIALDSKWIAILNNQKRFVSDKYDGKHIVKETTV